MRKKLGCYICECAPSLFIVGEGWWKIFRDRIVFRGNGRGNQSSPGKYKAETKETWLLINCWWETGREPQSQQSLFNVSGTLWKIILQERKKPRQWDHFWKEILSNSKRIQLHTPTVFPTTNCLRLPWQTYYCSPFSLVHKLCPPTTPKK